MFPVYVDMVPILAEMLVCFQALWSTWCSCLLMLN